MPPMGQESLLWPCHLHALLIRYPQSTLVSVE
jgi:hypothetical protein